MDDFCRVADKVLGMVPLTINFPTGELDDFEGVFHGASPTRCVFFAVESS